MVSALIWPILAWIASQPLYMVSKARGAAEIHPVLVLLFVLFGVRYTLRQSALSLAISLFVALNLGGASIVLAAEGSFPFVHSIMLLLVLGQIGIIFSARECFLDS